MNETNKAEPLPLSDSILSNQQQSNELQFKHAEQQLIDYIIEQKDYLKHTLYDMSDLDANAYDFFMEMYRLSCLLEYEKDRRRVMN